MTICWPGCLRRKTHETIRLSATLTTGDPVVPLTDDHPFDVRRLRIGSKLGQRRIHSGGNLVSSAFDLVRTAKELGRLSELQLAIDGCRVREELQERCRLLLQSIAAMADGDENTAGVAADELFRTRTSLMNHWKSETSISANRAWSTDGNDASLSVVWKNLSVKAERIVDLTE